MYAMVPKCLALYYFCLGVVSSNMEFKIVAMRARDSSSVSGVGDWGGLRCLSSAWRCGFRNRCRL